MEAFSQKGQVGVKGGASLVEVQLKQEISRPAAAITEEYCHF
jgi:hypothetical protein